MKILLFTIILTTNLFAQEKSELFSNGTKLPGLWSIKSNGEVQYNLNANITIKSEADYTYYFDKGDYPSLLFVKHNGFTKKITEISTITNSVTTSVLNREGKLLNFIECNRYGDCNVYSKENCNDLDYKLLNINKEELNKCISVVASAKGAYDFIKNKDNSAVNIAKANYNEAVKVVPGNINWMTLAPDHPYNLDLKAKDSVSMLQFVLGVKGKCDELQKYFPADENKTEVKTGNKNEVIKQ